MNENELYSREIPSFEERELRRAQNGNVKTSQGVRNEFFFKTVVCQTVISLILLVLLLLFRSLSPSSFEGIKQKYISLMKRDISFEEMASAFKSVTAFATEKETAVSVDEEQTQPKVEKEETEAKSQAEANLASGGEDIAPAEENTTFSPIMLSRKIISPLEEYTVTSVFGYRTNPITDKYGFHTGLDMAAPLGTEIKAALDGVVIDIGNTEARGNYIVLQHSDNVTTAYYHCQKILCEISDRVTQADKIALVGSTGWSTGPHLHFEVKINGISCNPEYLLNAE